MTHNHSGDEPRLRVIAGGAGSNDTNSNAGNRSKGALRSRLTTGGGWRRLGWFAGVGITVMGVGAAVLWVGVEVLEQPLWWVYAVQVAVALNLSFVLNDAITWRDRRGSHQHPLGVRWLLFVASRAVSTVATTIIFAGLVQWIPYLAAHVASIGVMTVANFFFADRIVFRPHRGDERPTAVGANLFYAQLVHRWQQWAENLFHADTQVNAPRLSVVLPVKGNAATVAATVGSLLTQDIKDIEVIVVVDEDDPAHHNLAAAYGDHPGVHIIHPTQKLPLAGRDANYRRLLGVTASTAAVVAMVDADMLYPPDWASRGLELLDKHPEVGVVVGPVRSLRPGEFWQGYVDTNPMGSKTPRWERSTIINADNFGRSGAKPGITANLFVRSEDLTRIDGVRPDFVYTYDDYAFLYDLASAGVAQLCSPELMADHHHRDNLAALIGEYVSAGQGCADFAWSYPTAPLTRRRLGEVFGALMGLALLGIAGWHSPGLTAAVVGGTLTVLAAGVALRVRNIAGLAYPVATLVLGSGFVYGFLAGALRGGPAAAHWYGPRAVRSRRGVDRVASQLHPVEGADDHR